MAYGGATTPALSAAAGEITAKPSDSARPTYVESKLDNGAEAHVPVGQQQEGRLHRWGRALTGMSHERTESRAPGVTEATALPRVASTFTGVSDDMAPGMYADGRADRYANQDTWDGELLLGDTHDVHAQTTDTTGRVQLFPAEYRTRRQEQFPNKRKGFGATPTAPQATAVNFTIDQVAPDAKPTNGQFNGSLNASTLGSVWNGSGSAYNPVPAPADAVIVNGNAQNGMRSWG